MTEFVPQTEHPSFPLQNLLLVVRIILNRKVCCILQCKTEVAVDEAVVEMAYLTFTSIVLVDSIFRNYGRVFAA